MSFIEIRLVARLSYAGIPMPIPGRGCSGVIPSKIRGKKCYLHIDFPPPLIVRSSLLYYKAQPENIILYVVIDRSGLSFNLWQ